MRSAFVSVALLALAHSLAPGVHGAPAVVSGGTNSLAVRQDTASLLALLNQIIGLIQSTLGTVASTPSQLAEQLAHIAREEVQIRAASGVLSSAPPSSSDSTSLTTLSSTRTSLVSAVATGQMGTSTVSSMPGMSLSTPQASSTPGTRMRRQSPPPLPIPVPSNVLSIVGSQSAPLPVPSIAASALSAVLSQVGSVTPQSAASEPTPSNPSVSTTRA